MKILIVGEGRFDIYEKALAEGLTASGHQVVSFYWKDFFDPVGDGLDAVRRLQRRSRRGPLIARINRVLIEVATESCPDAIFIFRGDIILPSTFRSLRRVLPGTVLAAYNNDDAFSPAQPKHRFRHFVASLPLIDVAFAYRPANLDDFRRTGAREVALLPPWYIPEINRPEALDAADVERFDCDVVFVGHYEPDGRLDMLAALAEAGHRVRIFGTDWPRQGGSGALARQFPVTPVRGRDYAKALSAAKIALVFLSRVNRDRYTRRNFEIPATGAFMLSEYTDELAEMFEPGVHADYFEDGGALLAKVGYYLSHDDVRCRIARAAQEHAAKAGFDVVSRAREVAAKLEKLRSHVAYGERAGC